MENRLEVAAQHAVRAGTYYWEALAIDLDARLIALLCPEALVLSEVRSATTRCATLRAFHQVTRAQCLLMATVFPGRMLLDASVGLRYSQHPHLGRANDPAGVEGPIWTLRLVLDDGLWRVDPYSEERDWPEIGTFTIETEEPAPTH